MIPREYSSGERQRLGGLSKQGNPLLRFLWGEAGAHAVRRDPELQRFYRRKLVQKQSGSITARFESSGRLQSDPNISSIQTSTRITRSNSHQGAGCSIMWTTHVHSILRLGI
jgi:hypothetical protein